MSPEAVWSGIFDCFSLLLPTELDSDVLANVGQAGLDMPVKFGDYGSNGSREK